MIAFVLGLALLLLLARLPLAPARRGRDGAEPPVASARPTACCRGLPAHWAEGLLDFTSTGTVTDWVPLFAFVILFGLSMDYTILVLERIREARRDGPLRPRGGGRGRRRHRPARSRAPRS